VKYPVSEETKRPYRLWNANDKCPIRWRYYSEPRRAHVGALIEARWAKISVTIEVYNAINGRMLGQYTRRVNTVAFRGE
jgi:hypothetical protein